LIKPFLGDLNLFKKTKQRTEKKRRQTEGGSRDTEGGRRYNRIPYKNQGGQGKNTKKTERKSKKKENTLWGGGW